ncbi:MAG: hypothetical protein H7249_12820 [Chitinophagaceae bacterium]|nr:hypothetical protein [Oligoflexus sp.]
MSDQDVKAKLKKWIIGKNPTTDLSALSDSTPLITQKLITSVQMLDFILFMESIGANEFDPETLTPQSFATIDTIYQNFFA